MHTYLVLFETDHNYSNLKTFIATMLWTNVEHNDRLFHLKIDSLRELAIVITHTSNSHIGCTIYTAWLLTNIQTWFHQSWFYSSFTANMQSAVWRYSGNQLRTFKCCLPICHSNSLATSIQHPSHQSLKKGTKDQSSPSLSVDNFHYSHKYFLRYISIYTCKTNSSVSVSVSVSGRPEVPVVCYWCSLCISCRTVVIVWMGDCQATLEGSQWLPDYPQSW
jgi:hypothetical protein